jgi:hypothetical protein
MLPAGLSQLSAFGTDDLGAAGARSRAVRCGAAVRFASSRLPVRFAPADNGRRVAASNGITAAPPSKAAGIAERTLYRAKRELKNIITKKDAAHGGWT